MPEFTVDVFAVSAFHAAPLTQRPIHGTQRREKRGPRAIKGRPNPVRSRGDRDSQLPSLVTHPFLPNLFQLRSDDIERLIPADFLPTGIFAGPFSRIGAFHRSFDPMGVIELFDQTHRFKTAFPVIRMHAHEIGVAFDLIRNTLLIYVNSDRIRTTVT